MEDKKQSLTMRNTLWRARRGKEKKKEKGSGAALQKCRCPLTVKKERGKKETKTCEPSSGESGPLGKKKTIKAQGRLYSIGRWKKKKKKRAKVTKGFDDVIGG